MAHSDSARRFSLTVPGPLSSQFPTCLHRYCCATNFFPPKTPDSRIQELSSLHKSASIHPHSEFLYYRADAVLSFPVTIYGLVSGADTALLSHENQQRLTDNDLRREARIDLARRGLVPTESQIMKWKDEHKR